MKILHCPTDVGGHPWGLSRAEREIGLDSRTMVFKTSRFRMGTDIDLDLDSVLFPVRLWTRWKFFRAALAEYDVFHFNFGTSILDARWLGLHHLDLPVLRRARKAVVVTYQGCDARMKLASRRMFETTACHECTNTRCNGLLDRLRGARIAKVQRFAQRHFVLNPDLIHHAPQATFLPYAALDPREWMPLPPSPAGGTLRVVHSPTDRSIKGTHYVVEAVERLQREGLPLELVLVEGKTREEARRIYEAGDIFVDQVLVGWYGGFAVEAMALARPVLCYIRESDLRFVPPAMAADLPVVRTTPATLADDLRRLALDPALRAEFGARGRAFVETHHDPRTIATAMARVYAEALAEVRGKRPGASLTTAGAGASRLK